MDADDQPSHAADILSQVDDQASQPAQQLSKRNIKQPKIKHLLINSDSDSSSNSIDREMTHFKPIRLMPPISRRDR